MHPTRKRIYFGLLGLMLLLSGCATTQSDRQPIPEEYYGK